MYKALHLDLCNKSLSIFGEHVHELFFIFTVAMISQSQFTLDNFSLQAFLGMPMVNIQMKSTLEKLFRSRYSERTAEVMDEKENKTAIDELV